MEYVANVTINFRRQDRPLSLAPQPLVLIAAGETFDPEALGVPHSEVMRLLARGHIAAPAQPDVAQQVVTTSQPPGVSISGQSQHRKTAQARNVGVFDAVDKAIELNRKEAE